MKILRVRPGVAAAVYVKEYDVMVTIKAGDQYEAGDPVVKEHPWAFQRDAEVEAASADPGEKRNR